MYDRRSYEKKKTKKMSEVNQSTTLRDTITINSYIPARENRLDCAYTSCTFCRQAVFKRTIIRCVMCSEPRYAMSRCLEIPIDDSYISATYGYNGITSFFCTRCSRHMATCKDTVVLNSAMMNNIQNATSTLEEKIRMLEKTITEGKIQHDQEKVEWKEAENKLLCSFKKKRERNNEKLHENECARLCALSEQLMSECEFRQKHFA